MPEVWIPWYCAPGFYSKYATKSIVCDKKFHIELFDINDEAKQIRVFLPCAARAYRVVRALNQQDILIELGEKYELSLGKGLTFFEVKNSSYLRWLSEESVGMIDNLNAHHYALITTNVVVDIISSIEPMVEFISLP